MIYNFFQKLEKNGIDCVVFKSWDDIEKLDLAEAVELDVFVQNTQRDMFTKIALEFGFYHRKTTIERQTGFFYIIDSNRLLMIHVAYQIITGSRFKNCPLSIEKELINSNRRVNGIRISDQGPYLYYHTIKYILLGTRKHLSVLEAAEPNDKEFVDRKAIQDYAVGVSITAEALATSKNRQDRLKLKREFILKNLPILVKGAFIHTLDRIGSRLRWIFKKRGFEMAFVGVDGGGKSTLSSEIIRRFNFLGCRKTLYLGPKFDNKVISITSRFLIALFGKLRSKFGVVTVYDRHLFDLVAYRDQSLFTTKLLKAIIPKPDYVFFCHADIDIILNRKEHDNRKLLEFVSQNYSTLSDEIDYFFNINTERTSDDAVSQIVKILDSRIRASLI